MQTHVLRSLFIILAFSCAFISFGQERPFITTWETTENDESITIPTEGGGYDYDINWESVEDANINGELTNQTGDATITFEEPGTYRVSISGDFPRIYFEGSDSDNSVRLKTIEQWGDNEWQSMAGAFYDCRNMTITVDDNPDLNNVTDMSGMFYDARSFNQDIGSWDVSNVTDMSDMFRSTGTFSNAISFNQDIGEWDVSNVTDMSGMFYRAYSFNQDLNNWDVSSVTDMSGMFYGPNIFNQDIGNWDVSNVTDMSWMFRATFDFNQDIGDWDVSNVTDMSGMFFNSSFNQSIGGWDVSNVTDMSEMFEATRSFNQDISSWDVSNVTDMSYMFDETRSFNQNIGDWNVSNVYNMAYMFFRSGGFNQDIGSWDVSNVTNMSWMFADALVFNQDISSWDVSNVTDMSNMFRVEGGTSFNQDIGNWDVSNVTDMSYMFFYTDHFDQSIGNWDISNVTDMNRMFSFSNLSTENYDQTLQGWAQQIVQENISLGANELTYCLAEEDRKLLIDDYGWTIEGDEKAEDCIPTATSSTEELTVSVYPNPASDQLFIELPQGSSAQLDIIDYTGHSVYTAATSGANERVDVSGFAPGVYIIQLQGEHTTTTHRFVKE